MKTADHLNTKTSLSAFASRLCLSLAVLGTFATTAAFANASTTTTTTPAQPSESQFIDKLESEAYPSVAAPTVNPEFKWDFSQAGVTHQYDFRQEVLGHSKMNMGTETQHEQNMSAQGNLLVRCRGEGLAELVLKDLKIKMSMGMDESPLEQEIPPMVVQGVKEDGTGSFGQSPQEMLLKMLFPIPGKQMQVGESISIPAQMPLNAMGSLLQINGNTVITLADYVKINERTCARFDVSTNISDIQIPPELEGSYVSSNSGKSVFYFDIEKKVFVSGTIAFLMQFEIDAPMPTVGSDAQHTHDHDHSHCGHDHGPQRTKMSITSDNLIKVNLLD